jgi:xylan 1,4-beta-xylosidase
MLHSSRRYLRIVVFGLFAISFASLVSAQANQNSLREVAANVKDTRGPVDRFFDLSVGSDYPGTLIRDNSQAQLKLVTDELGFRYIRFHAKRLVSAYEP